MSIQTMRTFLDRHGILAAARELSYRAANKVTDVMILKAMSLTMDSLDRTFADVDAGLRWGFLARAQLVRGLVAGAGEDMDERFIDEATARGDRCYGALDGEILASYGWYSTRPTPLNGELLLRFDPAYAYMYKGFTLPAYRGRRLHGIGMARAMKAHVDQGLRGLVSYVRSNNSASLTSCYRLGYTDIGTVFVVRLGGRYVTHATRGCTRCAFRVEPMIP